MRLAFFLSMAEALSLFSSAFIASMQSSAVKPGVIEFDLNKNSSSANRVITQYQLSTDTATILLIPPYDFPEVFIGSYSMTIFRMSHSQNNAILYPDTSHADVIDFMAQITNSVLTIWLNTTYTKILWLDEYSTDGKSCHPIFIYDT